mgnify:CR=1 FL=1
MTDDALNVGIAVREAVINAIVHGNRMDPSRKVEVSLEARAAVDSCPRARSRRGVRLGSDARPDRRRTTSCGHRGAAFS